MYVALTEFCDGHRNPGNFHQNIIPAKYRGYLSWTLTRNPYSRLLSAWCYVCKRPDELVKLHTRNADFPAFVEAVASKDKDPLQWPIAQWRWLAPARIDMALQLEACPEVLRALPFWHDGIVLPRYNQTNHSPWQSYYTPDLRELARQWAGHDFELFGYAR